MRNFQIHLLFSISHIALSEMYSKHPHDSRRSYFLFPTLVIIFFLRNSLRPQDDQCFQVSRKDGGIGPHSRSLCILHDVCMGNSTLWRKGNRPVSCNSVTPQWKDTGEFMGDCELFRWERVECAHGKALITGYPSCPEGKSKESRWWNELAVIVPEYPWPENIFHYGNSITTIIHAVKGLQKIRKGRRRVQIVFSGEKNLRTWQSGFVHALFRKLQKEINVGLRYEAEGCWKEAIVLGLRGSHNVWPFANATNVDLEGREIGMEAVWVKDAVYAASGIDKVFRNGQIAIGRRIVAYAKRVGLGINTGRVFGDEDEIWMENMLRVECAKRNVSLEVWDALGSFEEQVRRAERAGVVIGIHGANLVNSWFVRPFGGLVEIAPRGVNSTCYVGGSNAGLRYWRWESKEWGDGEDCNSEDEDCSKKIRARRMKIGGVEGKEKLRGIVREAVEYLVQMHETAGRVGGYYVKYDEEKEVYVRE